MAKFFIIQWLGSDKYYIKGTYCGRILLSSKKIDARHFTKTNADKYFLKVTSLNQFAEFSIRELA